MKNWNERPFEIRNLFNPGFCGVILLRAFQGFEEKDNSGMPFSLALLVLPLCLHKSTREILLNNPRRYLLKTISENPQMLVGFAERTKNLLPYTFEALGFTMQLQSFEVTSQGRLKMRDEGIRKKLDGTQESIACQRVARTVGMNFAVIGDRVTIYTSLGVRP
jgi:hypothetical protein